MSFVCRRSISKPQKWMRYCFQPFDAKRGHFSPFSSVAYIWGAGDGGQLGTGTQEPSLFPIKFPVSGRVSHIGCGYGFTLAADAESTRVWTTGLNSFSQLGRQLSGKKLEGSSILSEIGLTPAAVDLHTTLLSATVQQISCGRSHSAILTDNRDVLTCGGHYQGQCGVGDLDLRSIKQFTKIPVPSIAGKIKQIACGLDHTLLLTSDGRVFSCGWGADGQTGLGHFKDNARFELVGGALKDVRIKQIATSADCCLALSDEGEVFSWGNNEYNQLATSSDEEQFAVPTIASLLTNLPQIKQVSAGGSNCCVLTASGEVYSWGYGILGHDREISFTKTPRKIQAFDNIEETVGQVSCGPDYSAVVTDSGALYTWGRGSFGRLGLGSVEDQWIPRKVVFTLN